MPARAHDTQAIACSHVSGVIVAIVFLRSLGVRHYTGTPQPYHQGVPMLLSTIVEGEAAWSDFLFLLALIIFLVVAFVRRASVDGCLLAVGFAALAAGLFVL